METRDAKHEKKEIYLEPKIIATYTKEELEETIKPHGINFHDYGNGVSG
jgi:hypothetical protein